MWRMQVLGAQVVPEGHGQVHRALTWGLGGLSSVHHHLALRASVVHKRKVEGGSPTLHLVICIVRYLCIQVS